MNQFLFSTLLHKCGMECYQIWSAEKGQKNIIKQRPRRNITTTLQPILIFLFIFFYTTLNISFKKKKVYETLEMQLNLNAYLIYSFSHLF